MLTHMFLTTALWGARTGLLRLLTAKASAKVIERPVSRTRWRGREQCPPLTSAHRKKHTHTHTHTIHMYHTHLHIYTHITLTSTHIYHTLTSTYHPICIYPCRGMHTEPRPRTLKISGSPSVGSPAYREQIFFF